MISERMSLYRNRPHRSLTFVKTKPPQVDRDFSFRIAVRIGGDAWMNRHQDIIEFCGMLIRKRRAIGRERRVAINGDADRLCLKTAELAETFRARFAGELLCL
jgi:hypothetical protein